VMVKTLISKAPEGSRIRRSTYTTVWAALSERGSTDGDSP
jgi:hypothetical protein